MDRGPSNENIAFAEEYVVELNIDEQSHLTSYQTRVLRHRWWEWSYDSNPEAGTCHVYGYDPLRGGITEILVPK